MAVIIISRHGRALCENGNSFKITILIISELKTQISTFVIRREPKASKEAGKILAKATRGAAVGGVGVSAAAEASARVARATGLEAKT